jgi:phosphoribosyl 1,2-cyclic phosphodiesterase
LSGTAVCLVIVPEGPEVMKIKFWGVRGSFPVPGDNTIKYGGNTSCVEVTTDSGMEIIIDAGTGIRCLGDELMKKNFGRGRGKAHIFISHTHWDHIQGLLYFRPVYIAGNEFYIFARKLDDKNLKNIFFAQTEDPYFPVHFDNLLADVHFKELSEGDIFMLKDVEVRTERLNHPWIALGYRFQDENGSVAYISDTAPFKKVLLEKKYYANAPDENGQKSIQKELEKLEKKVLDMVKNVDVLIYDSHFTAEEYLQFPHWGHSTPEEGIELAVKAKAKSLVLFHHAPERDDKTLDKMKKKYFEIGLEKGINVLVAKEGMELLTREIRNKSV